MDFIEKNRGKISMVLGIAFLVCILVAIGVLVIGLNSDNNNQITTNDNTIIQNLYSKANEEFEKGNLREMQIELGKIQERNPDEDIQAFIDEKLASLPIIEASTLIKDYKDNVVNVNLKYEDKLIKVSGKVTNIGEDITKTVYITIGEENHTFYDVRCEFEYEEEISQVAELKKGEYVTVLGTYKDITSMCPRLDKCYILDK